MYRLTSHANQYKITLFLIFALCGITSPAVAVVLECGYETKTSEVCPGRSLAGGSYGDEDDDNNNGCETIEEVIVTCRASGNSTNASNMSVEDIKWTAQDPESDPYINDIESPPSSNDTGDGKTPSNSTDCPLNIAKKKKIERQTDWVGTGDFPLKIERELASRIMITGTNLMDYDPLPVSHRYGSLIKEYQFGMGWKSNFDKRIEFDRGFDCHFSVNPSFSKTAACGRTQSAPNFLIDKILYKKLSGYRWQQSRYQKATADVRFINGMYEVVYSDGVVEKYKKDGRVSTVTSLNGITHTYTYLDNTSSRIDNITHSSGYTLDFNWSGNRLASIATPDGTITYSHNSYGGSSGNHYLSQVSYPGSTGSIGLIYEKIGTQTQGLAKVQLDDHDYKIIERQNNGLDGDPISSGLVGGVNKTTIAGRYNTLTVTNALGAETIYHYSSYRANLNKIERPSAAAATCPSASAETYYAEAPRNSGPGLVEYVSHKDNWRGVRTVYSYYDAEREILKTEYSAGKTIKYVWDTYGRISKKSTWAGELPEVDCTLVSCDNPISESAATPIQKITYEYYGSEQNHRLHKLNLFDSAGQKQTKIYSYQFHSNNVVQMATIDGPRTDVSDISYQNYDSYGRLISTVNALGHTVTYRYNSTELRPWQIEDAIGFKTDYKYDSRGRTTEITTYHPSTIITKFEYNRFGKVSSIKNPGGGGGWKDFKYDDAGRLKTIWQKPVNTAYKDEKTSFVWDKLNNLLSTKHTYTKTMQGQTTTSTPNGPVVVDYEYEAWFTDISTSNEYEPGGELKAALGNYGQRVDFTYDENLNVKTLTNSLGQKTSYTYTDTDLVKTEKNPNSETITYNYDELSRITSIRDARGKITEYDRSGGLAEDVLSSPDTGETTYSRNSAGLLETLTRNDGTTITYEYDALNRVNYVDSDGAGTPFLDYAYDDCTYGKGKLCSVTTGHGKTAYEYTKSGKLRSQTETIGGVDYSVAYGYGQYDINMAVSLNNGGSTAYYSIDNHNEQKNVTAIVNGQWLAVANVIYEPGKKILKYGNGMAVTTEFDLDGRTKSISWPSATKTYGYDTADRITSISGGAAGAYTYSYDSAGRLQFELKDNNASSYASYVYKYDKNGNRESKSQGPKVKDYVVDSQNNQLKHDGSYAYEYDANGNLKAVNIIYSVQIDAAGNRENRTRTFKSFQYDGFNRLERLFNNGPPNTYKYNYQNLRVSRNVGSPGKNYRYIYNYKGQLIGETGANSDAIETTYMWLHDQVVGFVRGGLLYYVVNDHLGRPEMIYRRNSDGTSEQVWVARNLAFTREVAYNGIGSDFNIGFPGQYYDKESGLWYNWHRYYDANLGRYIQSDPIGLGGGINTYLYVDSNPLSASDFNGLHHESLTSALITARNLTRSYAAEHRYKDGVGSVVYYEGSGVFRGWANHGSRKFWEASTPSVDTAISRGHVMTPAGDADPMDSADGNRKIEVIVIAFPQHSITPEDAKKIAIETSKKMKVKVEWAILGDKSGEVVDGCSN